MIFALSPKGVDEKREKSVLKILELFGLLFQITDDILNLEETEVSSNKGVIGEDINEGKTTFIVLHAVKNLEGEELNTLMSVLEKTEEVSENEVKEVICILKETGAINAAKIRAEEIKNEILSLLEDFEDERIKNILGQLVEYIYLRKK